MTANLEPTAVALGVADPMSRCIHTNQQRNVCFVRATTITIVGYHYRWLFSRVELKEQGEIIPERVAGRWDLGKEYL